MKKTVLIFILLFRLAIPALAQQPNVQKQPPPPQPEPPTAQSTQDEVVRITTNLVQVDAVITDKSGKQVTDLKPEEIEIQEDGRGQKVTAFSYIPLESGTVRSPEPARPLVPNAPPIPAAPLHREQVRRTIALVVDDLGLSFESAHYVRQALKKFLDQQMQPDDLVAIIRTGGGIGALQQFTSDKRLLYGAVEKVKWNPVVHSGIGGFGPTGNSDPNGPVSDADIDQLREELFNVGTLGAVSYVVRGLQGLPGRKSVLLMSDGIKLFEPGNATANRRTEIAMKNLIDLANRASVVVYTMDARGLQSLGFTAADDSGVDSDGGSFGDILSARRANFFESQGGLIYLAQQTGGFAIRNNNDLSSGIKRVLDDQKGYYLIGFRPDESTFDKVSGSRTFHRLQLRVKRPGKFNVRMRNGFYGVTDEEASPGGTSRQQQLISALTSPFTSSGVEVRLTSLFADDVKSGTIMRSILHVKGRDLTFTEEPDGWHQAVFDILAVTFGDNGIVVDQFGRTHTLRVRAETYERIAKDGFTYSLTVPIKKPGAYQLRAALRDVSSGRVGSASQFIEVPDIKKKRLTLSGVVVKGIAPAVFKKMGSARDNKENADDSVDDSDPNAGPAMRQFKTGSYMLWGMAIYNSQVDKATGKPQLQTQVKLFRDGQPVFVGNQLAFKAGEQPDWKRILVNGAIQLGSDMPPGEYALQVIVADLLRKDKHNVANQWIDFEIVK
ncbi:MAG TPA: VWA domain-containing protein [Pyrinomonadaceae bacterium]|nr:VWA domain-containing protein [Pyrinomonadaceae bacterium]